MDDKATYQPTLGHKRENSKSSAPVPGASSRERVTACRDQFGVDCYARKLREKEAVSKHSCDICYCVRSRLEEKCMSHLTLVISSAEDYILLGRA